MAPCALGSRRGNKAIPKAAHPHRMGRREVVTDIGYFGYFRTFAFYNGGKFPTSRFPFSRYKYEFQSNRAGWQCCGDAFRRARQHSDRRRKGLSDIEECMRVDIDAAGKITEFSLNSVPYSMVVIPNAPQTVPVGRNPRLTPLRRSHSPLRAM
jgi:hypothetical protein